MYENMTDDFLRERMLSRVSDKLDKRPSALIYDTHEATANELAILYIELEYLVKNSFGDTAAREFLVRRAKERGIAPDEASQAILKGVFTPSTIDVLGKRFNADDLNYVVTKKKADGEYEVTCEVAGAAGNQHLGQIIPIEYIKGLETAELVEVLIPGEDEEDTEAFRTRYYESFNDTAFGGNQKDYQNKVRSISGVGDVKITRVWNGDIEPAAMIPSEEVQGWYNNIIKTMTGAPLEWLMTVYNAAVSKKLTVGGTVKLTIINSDFGVATDTLVDKVQTIIDPEQNAGEGLGLAPIGHVVHVVSVSGVSINVSTSITFSSDFSWDNLENSIRTAIEAYFLTLRKEWASVDNTIVRIAQIENHIMGITGVVDISGTKINGSEENIILGRDEVPILGEVKPG